MANIFDLAAIKKQMDKIHVMEAIEKYVSAEQLEIISDIVVETLDSNNHVFDVQKFLQVCGKDFPTKPTEPDVDTQKLIISLIFEELNEYATSCNTEALSHFEDLCEGIYMHAGGEGNDYFPEQVDALVDLQYVLYNAVVFSGLAYAWDDLHNEVHNSNMSKMCIDSEEASETVKMYASGEHPKGVVHTKIDKVDGYFVIKRKGDNKILKSVNYKPADIVKVLKSHNNLKDVVHDMIITVQSSPWDVTYTPPKDDEEE